jgi:uncharacterized protein with HEPN domain
MTLKSPEVRLLDIIKAIEHSYRTMAGISLEGFQGDLDRRRIVEIISEASRKLTNGMKDRHPEIPWRKVAGIGNILRHDYEDVSANALWNAGT